MTDAEDLGASVPPTRIIEVARQAGVSPATVSRTLHGTTNVAAPTRARVLEAVRLLGYHPNRLASGLRGGRSRTVALATGDIQQGIYSALAKHLQLELQRVDLDMLLVDLAHREERIRTLLERAPSLGLTGVLLASTDNMDVDALMPLIERAAASGISILSVSQRIEAVGIASIVHDNAAGARDAVLHLVERGYRRIGFLGRVGGSAIARDRLAGYRHGLEIVGGRVTDDLVLRIDGYRAEAGYRRVADALSSSPHFDAVVAASDELALGGIAAALDAGLRVPQDVGFVGFGALEWSRFMRPALTTVALNMNGLAAEVGGWFAALDVGKEPPLLRVIAPRMIVRDTT